MYFACDKCVSQVEEIWTGRVEHVKRIINAWEKRNLSIAGKVCIMKTVLISQFVYIMEALVVHDPVLTQVTEYYLDFCGVRKTVIARRLRKCRELLFVVLWKMMDST